jgi:hypothetical protein
MLHKPASQHLRPPSWQLGDELLHEASQTGISDLDLWLARIVRFTCTGHNELPFGTTRSGDNEVLAAKSRETAFEEIGARTPLRSTAFLQADLSGLGDNHRMDSLSKKKHSAVLDVVEQRHETEIHV